MHSRLFIITKSPYFRSGEHAPWVLIEYLSSEFGRIPSDVGKLQPIIYKKAYEDCIRG